MVNMWMSIPQIPPPVFPPSWFPATSCVGPGATQRFCVWPCEFTMPPAAPSEGSHFMCRLQQETNRRKSFGETLPLACHYGCVRELGGGARAPQISTKSLFICWSIKSSSTEEPHNLLPLWRMNEFGMVWPTSFVRVW